MVGEAHSLYLDLDDEITAVIDRICAVESDDVTVVIPKGAVVTQSIVNLKLLKRAVERAKKNVVLVTRDETGQLLATRAGFSVKATPSGEVIQPRPLRRVSAEPVIQEDQDSEPLTVGDESEVVEAVDLQPGVRSIVEAQQELRKKPSTAIRTPRRTRVLPRVARTDDTERSGNAGNNKPLERSRAVLSALMSRTGVAKKRAAKSSDQKRLTLLPDLPWKKIGAGTIVAIILGFIALTFLFAQASITVTPNTETASVEFELTAKEQPDAGKKEILGKLVSLSREGKKTIQATGKKETGEKATGSVTISNAFSNKAQPFGVNTRLQSGSGQVYLLTAQVSVPGATVSQGKAVAGTISASVIAENNGDEYNIAAGSFTLIDLPAVQQKGITAASDTPMSGGSKKEITVLTSEDVDSAKDAVKGELAPALTTEIKSKLTDEEELLDGASQGQVTKASTNKAVGEEADQVEVTVTVEVRALVTRPADVRAAAQAELSDSLPGNQELLNDEEEVVTWTKKAADFEQKRLIVSVQAEKKAAYRIDEAALRAELLGKQEDEAQSYLEGLSEVSSARVKLSPVWRNNLPKKASKVQIEVNR